MTDKEIGNGNKGTEAIGKYIIVGKMRVSFL